MRAGRDAGVAGREHPVEIRVTHHRQHLESLDPFGVELLSLSDDVILEIIPHGDGRAGDVRPDSFPLLQVEIKTRLVRMDTDRDSSIGASDSCFPPREPVLPREVILKPVGLWFFSFLIIHT